MLTKDAIKKIDSRAPFWVVQPFNEMVDKYKVPIQAAQMILANALHESASFSITSESLHYTTPSRIAAVWPSRFYFRDPKPGKKDAALFVKNSVLLGNEVYGGRMGNIPGTNDGYNFKGRGPAQITGRDAYQQFYNYKKASGTLEDFAELLELYNNNLAIESLFWFFCEFKKLKKIALIGDFEKVCIRWNGGKVGYAERVEIYNKVLKHYTN